MQKEAAQHGINTSGVLVANCQNPAEAQEKLLLPVLNHMAQHIQAIDEGYLQAKQQELAQLRAEIVQVEQQVREILKTTGMGKGISPAAVFSAQFKQFRNTEIELGLYISDLEAAKNDSDPDLEDILNEALNLANEDCGLPSIEELEANNLLEKDWRVVLGKKMHLMRNNLTGYLQRLDQGLRQSNEEMKRHLVSILRSGGLAQLALDCEDSRFLNVVLNELDPEQFPQLHQGFVDLAEFQLLYRGVFQHRLRESFSNLHPNETTYALPGGNQPIMNIPVENVQALLENALEDTLYNIENALRPLLKEPCMARYAVVEEFRDRIWKAADAEDQWRVFLDERKEKLWPEKFKWQSLLEQLQQQLNLLNLA